jgi:SAM-dependent methyltransferase
MKASALRFLACPRCTRDLTLTVLCADGPEIMEGGLSCAVCGASYPIVSGVARLVASGSYASSFDRQWNWFRTVHMDYLSGTNESERMLGATTGWGPERYKGRLILDVGVGAGRFAEIAARFGGEVVGVDLTTAVDAAYANIGRLPNVHLFQADIFAMPFRPHTFDAAYSIDALQHTCDREAACTRVASVVKQGGELAVYLRYGIGHRASNLMRMVTSRLPISLHRHWRWLDTCDWDAPKYQWKFVYPDVFRSFQASGFADLEIFDEPMRMRGTKTCQQSTPSA